MLVRGPGRKALLIAAVLWAVVVVAGCGPVGAEPALSRSDVFGVGPDDPVERAISEPARAVAVYWPDMTCLGCQVPALSVLDAMVAEGAGVRVLTVVPGQGSAPRPDLPGELIELSPADYERQVRALPPPRLEVWGSGGRELLLVRRLPLVVDRGVLHEELHSSLSFSSSGDGSRIEVSP